MSPFVRHGDIHAKPVHLLPAEILAAIFMSLRPQYQLRYKLPVEVALSHVCTRWRNVALGTPLLWTNINIYSSNSFDAVSNYLERSMDCPVNIRFELYDSDRAQFHFNGLRGLTQILPIVDLVVQHVSRWQVLFVIAYCQESFDLILSKMRDLTAPLLERIRIVGGEVKDSQDDDPRDANHPLDTRIFKFGTPRLISLHTSNLHYTPPLNALTALRLCDSEQIVINTRILPDLVAACPSLSTLFINGGFEGPWPIRNIAIPSLHSLWFATGGTFAAKFLLSTSLPNLKSLWLDGPHYPMIQEMSASESRPTFPSLQYMTLQSFDYYSSSLYAKMFPTITSLHLSYCTSFHVSFLEETLKEPLWRHLSTLVFRTARESQSAKFSKVLNNIVSARHGSGNAPIEAVLVDDDILASLTTAPSIREKTNLDVLRPDNFGDPWWIMSHTDCGDRL